MVIQQRIVLLLFGPPQASLPAAGVASAASGASARYGLRLERGGGTRADAQGPGRAGLGPYLGSPGGPRKKEEREEREKRRKRKERKGREREGRKRGGDF